jgi:uracil-DNA glycosylase
MTQANKGLDTSWYQYLFNEFEKDYFKELKAFLLEEKSLGKIIYPRGSEIFAALNITKFEDVQVVILGQDPYHGPKQAHGLSFSVPKGISTPPSLQNIYKELARDLGFKIPNHGNLSFWAKQGVLLLNAVLTVEANKANSHQNKGWEIFTDAIISHLNKEKEHLVFLLWGSYAQKKGLHIDESKHLVLKCPHPSPLSAHRGFMGNGHFSSTNRYLEKNGMKAIDWQLAPE